MITRLLALLSFSPVKKLGILFLIIGAFGANAQAIDETGVPQRVEALLKRLSLEDKINLMHTRGFLETVPVLDFKPSILNDGPHGVRNAGATAFPSQICMGSTWNRELLFQTTAALGSEAKTYKNTLVQLGPMINLIRHPSGGRNFEMFSEDPFLVGTLGVSYVKGLQSERVGACPKHIVCNEQETNRKGMDVQVDERTLREVYLLPFEMAVKEADPWFMMTGYNKLNGSECYRNRRLLTEIAREDWKFKGAFCSDWTAVKDAAGAVEAGLDFDLNHAMAYTTELPALVKSGVVSEAKIDALVRRILRIYILSGLLDGERPGSVNTPEHQQLARQVAQEGMVLLKNNGLLPFDLSAIKRIAVFGPNADVAHSAAGGSAGVKSPYEITPLQGLRAFCGTKVEVISQPYQDLVIPIPAGAFQSHRNGQLQKGLLGSYFNGAFKEGTIPDLTRAEASLAFNWFDNSPAKGVINANAFSARWTGELVPPATGSYTLSVVAKGQCSVTLDGKKILTTQFGDHRDQKSAIVELRQGNPVKIEAEFYKNQGDAAFSLRWEVPMATTAAANTGKLAASADVAVVVIGTSHRDESEGLDRPFWELPKGQAELICEVARANPRTVVVMVNGSPLEMASWQDSPQAIVEMWYAGMEGGNALADLLFGKVNPSGKLTVTIPRKIEEVASHGHFATPNVEMPEGVLVGYRHFDKRGIEPLYPFGHGLSYTTFKYSDLSISPDAGGAIAKFRITNTGSRAGAEIAQVYVGSNHSPVQRPVRELKGFVKITLQPGECKAVTVSLPGSAFAYYDVKANAWHVEKGVYAIEVGGSSRSLPLKESVSLPESLLP